MSAHTPPADISAYLEIRTSAPTSWSPDATKLLLSSDLSGTAQVHRLDLSADRSLPVDAEQLVPVTRFDEPIGAGYLPADPNGGAADRLLLATDVGGNERYQLFTAPDDPEASLRSPDDLEPLVLDPDHIHRPGGVTRDGRLLAYATNRGDGVARHEEWFEQMLPGSQFGRQTALDAF